MKLSLVSFAIIIISRSGITCVNLEGTYQQVYCENDKPSIVMPIPLLTSFHFDKNNVIKISQNECIYNFELNNNPMGTLSPELHSNWLKTYEQARDKYKVFFGNNSLKIKSRRVKPMPLINNNKVNISISIQNQNELQIKRKEVDTWSRGIPVIDRWNSTCHFKKI